MAEDLWKIRERKKMSVAQLALRSGLAMDLIEDYESGKPLTAVHRAKLAKMLYVNDYDIKLQSAPKPRPPKPEAAPDKSPTPAAGESTPQPRQADKRAPKPAKEPKPAAPPLPARPGQIQFLHDLSRFLGLSVEQMESQIGKPLGELTLPEARHWIKHYQSQANTPSETRLPGLRSRRAHLPEGVDEFELKYLTEAQQARAVLTVKLFNDEVYRGTLIGFGPYALTLQQPDGQEITLQKLGILYYQRQSGDAP